MGRHGRSAATKQANARRNPPGSAEGAFSIPADAQKTVLKLTTFGDGKSDERPATLADVRRAMDAKHPCWIQVEGFGDEALLTGIAQLFGLHKLALEDVVNTHQRPKLEEYPEHLYFVLHLWRLPCEMQQLSLFLGPNYVLTFQERTDGSLDALRERLRRSHAAIQRNGADYLCYTAIDTAIDMCFPVMEHLGEEIDAIELEILRHAPLGAPARIHAVKENLLTMRRSVWPMRDVLNAGQRHDSRFIDADSRLYLRDCYDHVMQVMELLEMYRELTSDLMEMHLSNTGLRTNEIMRVLTLISTIFMPLNFVAAVYGMNFDRGHPLNMPELGWKYGYVAALGLMAAMSAGFLIFFWRNGWLRKAR